jgi:hypothetical protein
MAHELDVWPFADRVGTLALVDGRLNFCYAPGWPFVAPRHFGLLPAEQVLTRFFGQVPGCGWGDSVEQGVGQDWQNDAGWAGGVVVEGGYAAVGQGL